MPDLTAGCVLSTPGSPRGERDAAPARHSRYRVTRKRSGCKGLCPDLGSADAGLSGWVPGRGTALPATGSPYHCGCLKGEVVVLPEEVE